MVNFTQEVIHDPYVLEFLNLKDYPALRETDIEKTLISNLQEFLLELGKGFCFVARQKRMRPASQQSAPKCMKNYYEKISYGSPRYLTMVFTCARVKMRSPSL